MLAAEGLRKRYRSREVVSDFGLTLDAGEVVGLLGPNGAGKTTCFYMIVGLVTADAGRIVLDGRDITDEPMYRRARLGVGYLPQEPSVFRKLSVADNIRLVLELRDNLGRKEREAELANLLGVKVHLYLHVKVKEGWDEDRHVYRDLGLDWVE